MSYLEEKVVVQNALDAAVKEGLISGATVLIRKDDQEVYYVESGYADLEAKKPIARDTIYRLYSQTKPITAAAMMLLVERGLVDLTDPVSKFLPGFKNQRVMKNNGTEFEPARTEATIADLMNMTSGLIYGGPTPGEHETDELFAEMIEKPNSVGTVEFGNRIGQCALAFHPGEGWRYGSGADVVGSVIEVVTGKRFGDFLQEEFFGPLEMKDTAFWVPEEKQDRFVKVYDCQPGQEAVEYTGSNLAIYHDMKSRPAFESGGAGLASTIDDYSHFAQMLLNEGDYKGKRIMSPGTVKYLRSHHLTPKQQEWFDKDQTLLRGFTYGNFMRVCKDANQALTLAVNGEHGWDGWLGCYFENIPSENMTILIMTQKFGAGTFTLTRKIRNIVLRGIV